MGLLDDIAAGKGKKKKGRKGHHKKGNHSKAKVANTNVSDTKTNAVKQHSSAKPKFGLKELTEKGVPIEVIEDMEDVFGFYSMGQRQTITRSRLQEFFREFGREYTVDDMKYVMKVFTDGDSSKEMGFEDFAKTMYLNMGRKDAFGDVYDMIHKDKNSAAVTKDELINLMETLGEDLSEEEMARVLPLCSTREGFMKFWGDNLVALVTPAPPPPFQQLGLPKTSTNNAKSVVNTVANPGKSAAIAPTAPAKPSGPPAKKDPRYKKYFMLLRMHMFVFKIEFLSIFFCIFPKKMFCS